MTLDPPVGPDIYFEHAALQGAHLWRTRRILLAQSHIFVSDTMMKVIKSKKMKGFIATHVSEL
jgi:hypothetical protein